MSAKEFPAGHVKLAVENKGAKVTEVYLYAPGDRIITAKTAKLAAAHNLPVKEVQAIALNAYGAGRA